MLGERISPRGKGRRRCASIRVELTFSRDMPKMNCVMAVEKMRTKCYLWEGRFTSFPLVTKTSMVLVATYMHLKDNSPSTTPSCLLISNFE